MKLMMKFTCDCTISKDFKFIFYRFRLKLFSVLFQDIIYIFSFQKM